MSHRRHRIAIFAKEHDFLEAARACTASGAKIVEAYTPHPVHGLDEVMGLAPSLLPWVSLIGGVLGAGLGLWLQYWCSATDWPLDVGGKPFDSFPAFVPIGFELSVLLSGVATFFLVLIRSGLLPGRVPRRAFLGTTDDRFALVVAGQPGVTLDRTLVDIFAAHSAVETREEAL